MKVLNRLNIITSAIKLVRITEDNLPDENAWDYDNTWYGFEHNVRLTRSANFKWYENCYGDRKDMASNALISKIKKNFIQHLKPQIEQKGHDYYKIEYYTLASDPRGAIGSKTFIVAYCSGGSRDTAWNNQFLVIQPEDVKKIEEIL